MGEIALQLYRTFLRSFITEKYNGKLSFFKTCFNSTLKLEPVTSFHGEHLNRTSKARLMRKRNTMVPKQNLANTALFNLLKETIKKKNWFPRAVILAQICKTEETLPRTTCFHFPLFPTSTWSILIQIRKKGKQYSLKIYHLDTEILKVAFCCFF